MPVSVSVPGRSTRTQRRVYLALHHTLKELASKRLAADQRNFEQVGRRSLVPAERWLSFAAEHGLAGLLAWRCLTPSCLEPDPCLPLCPWLWLAPSGHRTAA